MVVPDPPSPFEPNEETLPAGTTLYRVHRSMYAADAFNPTGASGSTRFAPFGDPTIGYWYGAETDRAAICESILHDVPAAGGTVSPTVYRTRTLSRVTTSGNLRLAAFMGVGLRKLGVSAEQLTTTDAADYGNTVAWAEAAHLAGFDGIAYMSRQCNTDRAYILFDRRVGPHPLAVDADFRRDFGDYGPGRAHLIEVCATAGVFVMA